MVHFPITCRNFTKGFKRLRFTQVEVNRDVYINYNTTLVENIFICRQYKVPSLYSEPRINIAIEKKGGWAVSF
jgi:hypothetical protein